MLDLPRYTQYLRIRRRWNRYQYDTTPCLMSVPCVFAAGCRATHERVQSYYTTYKNIKHPYCLKIQFYFIHILTTMYKTKRATTTHVRLLQHAMTMFIPLDLRGLGIMHSSRAWIDRPSAYLKHT